jgi:hypothetical protein
MIEHFITFHIMEKFILLDSTKIIMDRERLIQYRIISRIIGLIIFIAIMVILNIYYPSNAIAASIIGFLNDNFLFIIIMSSILLVADIFYSFIIPFSLPAPVFGAIGSIFMVTFIFRIFAFIGTVLQEDVLVYISWVRWIIYPIVFIIVLVSGYASILLHTFQKVPQQSQQTPKKEKIINITPKKHKTWNDVSDEFRNMLYDFFHNTRKNVNKKSKR